MTGAGNQRVGTSEYFAGANHKAGPLVGIGERMIPRDTCDVPDGKLNWMSEFVYAKWFDGLPIAD